MSTHLSGSARLALDHDPAFRELAECDGPGTLSYLWRSELHLDEVNESGQPTGGVRLPGATAEARAEFILYYLAVGVTPDLPEWTNSLGLSERLAHDLPNRIPIRSHGFGYATNDGLLWPVTADGASSQGSHFMTTVMLGLKNDWLQIPYHGSAIGHELTSDTGHCYVQQSWDGLELWRIAKFNKAVRAAKACYYEWQNGHRQSSGQVRPHAQNSITLTQEIIELHYEKGESTPEWASENPDRSGNSVQDMVCTILGSSYEEMMRDGESKSLAQARSWLAYFLTDQWTR